MDNQFGADVMKNVNSYRVPIYLPTFWSIKVARSSERAPLVSVSPQPFNHLLSIFCWYPDQHQPQLWSYNLYFVTSASVTVIISSHILFVLRNWLTFYISYFDLAFSAPASEPSKIDTPNVDVEKSKDPIIQPLEAKHAIAPISAAIFPEQEQDASSAEIRVPVDNANRLLYDLDATVNNMFDNSNMPTAKVEKSEDESIVDGVQVYSAANRELDFFPRQNDGSHQGQASVVTQLENLEKRLLVCIFVGLFF